MAAFLKSIDLKKTIIALVLVLALINLSKREIKRSPGVKVSQSPEQKNLPLNVPAIPFGKDVLQPLANFSLAARVLGKRRYFFDRPAKYSPFDLALGWKEMSDSAFLDNLKISQSGRFYWVKWKDLSISKEKIFNNSSNMHIIPANSEIKKVLRQIRVGHIIEVKGYLVRVDMRDGGEWKSSLTRTDRGDGACEIIYVEKIKILY